MTYRNGHRVAHLAFLAAAAWSLQPTVAQSLRPDEVLAAAAVDDWVLRALEPTGGQVWWEMRRAGSPSVGLLSISTDPREAEFELTVPAVPWQRSLKSATPADLLTRATGFLARLGCRPRPGWTWALAARPYSQAEQGGVTFELAEFVSVAQYRVQGRGSARVVLTRDAELITQARARNVEVPLRPPAAHVVAEAAAAAAAALGLPPSDAVVVGDWVSPSTTHPFDPGHVGPLWGITVFPKTWREGPAFQAALSYFGADTVVGAVQIDGEIPVDAMLGRCAMWHELTTRDPEDVISDALVWTRVLHDSHPVWVSEEALACTSIRARIGAPWWDRRAGGLLIDLTAGDVTFFHPAWDRAIAQCAAGGGLIATSTEGNGILRLLDPATGDRFDLGPFLAGRFFDPSLSADAKLLAYRDWRARGDGDIYFDRIIKDEQTGLTRPGPDHRRMRIDGDDRLPIFSPHGKLVYFVHGLEGPAQGDEPPPVSWSLCSASTDAKHFNSDYDKVLDLPGRPERLSAFPDGRRLLVSGEWGISVADVADRTLAPLGLPELRDSEVEGAGPLTIREPAVSPDGGRIAFSGSPIPTAGDKPREWFIYVCDLDGSHLKRVTPLADDAVDYYVFPQSGKSAFDLEKAAWIARSEKELQSWLERQKGTASKSE